MKIKMIVGQAGSEFVRNPGEEYEVENKEAKRLIESGAAVPVKAEKIEKASITKPKKK